MEMSEISVAASGNENRFECSVSGPAGVKVALVTVSDLDLPGDVSAQVSDILEAKDFPVDYINKALDSIAAGMFIAPNTSR